MFDAFACIGVARPGESGEALATCALGARAALYHNSTQTLLRLRNRARQTSMCRLSDRLYLPEKGQTLNLESEASIPALIFGALAMKNAFGKRRPRQARHPRGARNAQGSCREQIQVAHEDYEREATHVALEFRQKILALTLNVFVEEFVFSSPIFETARSCCLAR
jgi:hypothetical protein